MITTKQELEQLSLDAMDRLSDVHKLTNERVTDLCSKVVTECHELTPEAFRDLALFMSDISSKRPDLFAGKGTKEQRDAEKRHWRN
jgi:hypothetical protein